MRVILMEDIPHVGSMGDIVRVSDGYGRNYPIPQGLGALATEERAKAFAHQKSMIEHKKAKLHKAALECVEKLNNLSLTIEKAANDEKLHGSVTNRDIQEAIAAQGIEIDKRKFIDKTPANALGYTRLKIELYKGPEGLVTGTVVVHVEEEK